jgi:hypothetical protein
MTGRVTRVTGLAVVAVTLHLLMVFICLLLILSPPEMQGEI